MGYFFTADEHYYHENIIKYCNRPFENAEEMNEELIKRNNEKVDDEDIVYHLGDFTLKNTKIAEDIMWRLNGQHQFIKGSHDYWITSYWGDDSPYLKEIKIQDIHITLCHYAMRTWPRSHHGSIQLFGHSHGHLSNLTKQIDVGVDTNNFYPYSFEEIKIKLNENKS